METWKATPKIHLLQELLQYTCQIWGNPSYYWCYGDEDLVGMMIEIGMSCHVATLAYTALTKWLVLSFDVESGSDSDSEYI